MCSKKTRKLIIWRWSHKIVSHISETPLCHRTVKWWQISGQNECSKYHKFTEYKFPDCVRILEENFTKMRLSGLHRKVMDQITQETWLNLLEFGTKSFTLQRKLHFGSQNLQNCRSGGWLVVQLIYRVSVAYLWSRHRVIYLVIYYLWSIGTSMWEFEKENAIL